MPYSGKDDPDLPSNVKSKSPNLRAQWVNVFNSALASCQRKNRNRKNKVDCEAQAFRMANGVLKRRAGGK